MTKLHFDVLDKNRLDFWNKLGALSSFGAVLGGGTAIALQMGHRISRDFDIFVRREISPQLRKKVIGIIDHPYILELDNPEQLTLVSDSGTKITLLHYPFPPLHQLLKTDSLPLFHLLDLTSSKAYTIGRRGTWRDYVDIYFLLSKAGIGLKSVIDEAQHRFSNEFNPKLFLQQLTYTRDLGKFTIEPLHDKISPLQITGFFEKIAREYIKENIL